MKILNKLFKKKKTKEEAVEEINNTHKQILSGVKRMNYDEYICFQNKIED